MAMLAAALVLAASWPVAAWSSRGGHRGHHHFHHGPGIVIVVAPPLLGSPYWWGSPFPYPPPPVAPAAPAYLHGAAPAAGLRYYCQSMGGYYPSVPQCPEPWIPVPPRAP